MDCKTARLLLDFARPRPPELAGDEAADLAHHLHACPDCDAVARAERQFDDHIGRAVRDVPLPDGLRDRLLSRLADERRARYRRRTWRLAAAAAAVVLLAIGLSRFWSHHQLPAPDLDRMVESISQNESSRKGADSIQDWFRSTHSDHPMVAPREFDQQPLNYGLLAYADLGEWQGQRVPMLLFASGKAQAHVYVLSQKQFKLDELIQELPRMNSQGYMVAVCPCPEDAGILHVFIYKGDSMKPFLTGAAPVIH